MIAAVTAAEMREVERRAAERGATGPVLMAHAGRAVAQGVERLLGSVAFARVVVLCGPGNNGGDGLVAAAELRDRGARVTCFLFGRAGRDDSAFRFPIEQPDGVLRAERPGALDALRRALAGADVVLDAMLGTGRARPIAGPLAEVLEAAREAIQAAGCLVVAVDLPTGMDCDTGQADPHALPAGHTFCLGLPKVGFYSYPGAELAGRWRTLGIGLPPGLDADLPTRVSDDRQAGRWLPARPASSNKGTFGKALVVAGCLSYSGAPALAAAAAGRAGAGLVTLAVPEDVRPLLGKGFAEGIFLPLPGTGPQLQGDGALEALRARLGEQDAALIGPGLGAHPETVRVVRALLHGGGHAAGLVLDADALNALSAEEGWWRGLPQGTVITPHPGEFGRLRHLPVHDVQARRYALARQAAAEWGVVVVLKGAFTVIAAPDGRCVIDPSANPALATAGTGDVLAGAITGLRAQGVAPFEAAVAGVRAHARAGAALRDSLGVAGPLAGDLLPLLPRVMDDLRALAT